MADESSPEAIREDQSGATPQINFLDPADLERFRVESRAEIVRVLRDMRRSADFVTAYFDAGQSFLLTTVLEVDDKGNRVLLDEGPDADDNARLAETGQALFVANHRGVRVQFRGEQVQRVRLKDGPAFTIPLPESLVRVQRREFYRLDIPIAHAVRCRFHQEDGTPVEVDVLDIGLGGIGVLESEAIGTLEPGTVIHGCRLDLPDHGTVETDIEVRNRMEVERGSGRHILRAGCRFLHLDAATSARIQRYIHGVELERRRLSSG